MNELQLEMLFLATVAFERRIPELEIKKDLELKSGKSENTSGLNLNARRLYSRFLNTANFANAMDVIELLESRRRAFWRSLPKKTAASTNAAEWPKTR